MRYRTEALTCIGPCARVGRHFSSEAVRVRNVDVTPREQFFVRLAPPTHDVEAYRLTLRCGYNGVRAYVLLGDLDAAFALYRDGKLTCH